MTTTTTTTTSKTPTVLLVPGFWEGPSVLQPLSAALTQAGITVQTAALRSTGHAAPSALAHPADIDSSRKYTFGDDTAGVREAIRTAVEGAGDAGVVLFLHSVGGVVGCNATEGLDFRAWGRRGNGEGSGGGVRKIVFCAAGVAPVGFDGFGGPFAVEHQDEKGAYSTCLDPKASFFHDLPEDQAEKWHKELQIEPSIKYWASSGHVTHAGWQDVPSTYIICELDRLIPAAFQETLAGVAGSKVVRLEAGHVPFLSRTEDVAKIIIDEVNSLADV